MGTSGSASDWLAGAWLYSGRPDPVWPVPGGKAGEVVSRWNALPAAPETARPEPPALGYKGCWLRAPDGREWHAAAGVVTCGEDARADAGGAVERAILATAPEGLLPVLPI